jgi:hypothetical protein
MNRLQVLAESGRINGQMLLSIPVEKSPGPGHFQIPAPLEPEHPLNTRPTATTALKNRQYK